MKESESSNCICAIAHIIEQISHKLEKGIDLKSLVIDKKNKLLDPKAMDFSYPLSLWISGGMLKFLIKCKIKGSGLEADEKELKIKFDKVGIYLEDKIFIPLNDDQERSLISSIEMGLTKAMRAQFEPKTAGLSSLQEG